MLILFLVVCQLSGSLSTVFVDTGSSDWYQALVKPTFQPPGWVFGPVWGFLYAAMGVAAYLVWMRREAGPLRTKALGWFVVQLALNASWTPVFFGAHRIGLALVILVALWFAIVGTILAFRRVDKTAAALLWPYLAWVSFATVLNAAIWRLN